ncbi:uncharacterized protein LOC109543053 [Dendroctonus ponderosae]|uniref:Uncharacterized protein n=1 Tax=Dendroctonus ponderosae TaxID=77166 RepID=U4UP67_DENPD|nr:uncharacterized protein LOC109543053 [Dendroctonus ponderosae]ERL91946.1 hypothetical protein D910_09269 [Dendroctonus ponderosae]KAH1026911.1 hypothetical protein HUJ05_000506 [Dendroctonus ponderosae]KAH1026912.1 hypothetical protein HUJ05_000506 [Dendroctonus ponderosae]
MRHSVDVNGVPTMDCKTEDHHEKILQDGIQKIVIVRQESLVRNGNVLSLVDILLAIFVVTPLVVFAWRGSWGLMDIYVDYFPLLGCFLVGMGIHIFLATCQNSLHRAIVESDKHWTLKIVSQFLRRCYTYLFLTATVLHWRGGWGLLDYLTQVQFSEEFVAQPKGSHWFLITWVLCVVMLVILKGLRNSIAPPFAICIDKSDYVFKFPTMFSGKSQNNIFLCCLDASFSVAFLGNLVVVFWRGLWILTDFLLFPNNVVWAAWASLVLGLVLVGLEFRLQARVKILCTTYSGARKIAVADAYITLSCVATILYWRGVWSLTNIYFLPHDPVLSCKITHLVGFMFLVILNCSNSTLVRGVYTDGQESNGECVVFPCQYLRILLEQENESESDEGSNSSAEKMINNLDNVTV